MIDPSLMRAHGGGKVERTGAVKHKYIIRSSSFGPGPLLGRQAVSFHRRASRLMHSLRVRLSSISLGTSWPDLRQNA